jgi:lipopolysaccharide/colanic/teichoic acid biosynthesis glycosyltransferase
MIAKRAFDAAVAGLLLVILSPLLAIIALAVVLDSRGPALYISERIGKRGRPFAFYKFRSMVQGAERQGGGLEIAPADPRITRVGQALRRTSLDELPQLINILKGEMSLVGPRPTVRSQVARYTPLQRRRLEALPGVTGWAQVNGRNLLSWPQRIELDIWYVDHWSFWLDLRILLLTVPLMLGRRGLYSSDGATHDL